MLEPVTVVLLDTDPASETVELTKEEEAVDEDVDTVKLVETTSAGVSEPFLYICNLLPAPQYWNLLPGHIKLQSFWLSALALPLFGVLPQ